MKSRTSSHRRRRRPAPGATPGTLVVAASAPKPAMRIMDYAPDQLEEKSLAAPAEVVPYLTDGTPSITWVDVQGLGDQKILEELRDIFKIHQLSMADVVNTPQRPKVENFEDYLFLITRMATITPAGDLQTEQVSFFLGRGFVLTFQETYGDPLDPVRERIRKGTGLLRKSGPDYLTYAILNAIVDHYFPVIETLGDRIEDLEEEVVAHPTPATLKKIYAIRRDLLEVRRGIWPQRDAISALLRDESGFIGEGVHVYLRDCYEHSVELIEVLESLRELTGGLLDVYLSSIAQRTNDVMKFLTVVTSIFIPLTFIAGVYGMNFDTSLAGNMPELTLPYAYVALWVFMIAIGVGLLFLFARKGWLRGVAMPARSQRGKKGGSAKS